MNSKRPRDTKELPIELQDEILTFVGSATFDVSSTLTAENKDEKAPPEDPDFTPFVTAFTGQALRSLHARRLTFLKDMHKLNTTKELFRRDEITRINLDRYKTLNEEVDLGKWLITLIDTIKEPDSTVTKPNVTVNDLAIADNRLADEIEERLIMLTSTSTQPHVIERQWKLIHQLCERNQLNLIIKIYKDNPNYPLIPGGMTDNTAQWEMLTKKIIAEKRWALFMVLSRREDYRDFLSQYENGQIHFGRIAAAIIEKADEKIILFLINTYGRKLDGRFSAAFDRLKEIHENNQDEEQKSVVEAHLKTVMLGLPNSTPSYIHILKDYFDYAYQTDNLALFEKILSYYLQNKPRHIINIYFLMNEFCLKTEPKARPFQQMLLATPELYTPAFLSVFKPLLARRLEPSTEPQYNSNDVVSWVESVIFPPANEEKCWHGPLTGDYLNQSNEIVGHILLMDQQHLFGKHCAIHPDALTDLLLRLSGNTHRPALFKTIVGIREALYASGYPIESDRLAAWMDKYQVTRQDMLVEKLPEAALADDVEAVNFIYCHVAGNSNLEARFSHLLTAPDAQGRTLAHRLCLAKSTPENSQIINFIFSITDYYHAYPFYKMRTNPFVQPDKYGITPLHLALQFSSVEKAKTLLIKTGLQLSQKTADGRNSLDFVIANQDRSLYTLIHDTMTTNHDSPDELHSTLRSNLSYEVSQHNLNFDFPAGNQVLTERVFNCYLKMRKKQSPQCQFEALCLVYLLERPIIEFLLPRVDLYQAYLFFKQTQLSEPLEKEDAPTQTLRRIAKKENEFKLDETVLREYIPAKLLIASYSDKDKRTGVKKLASLFQRVGLPLDSLFQSEVEEWEEPVGFLTTDMERAMKKIIEERESAQAAMVSQQGSTLKP